MSSLPHLAGRISLSNNFVCGCGLGCGFNSVSNAGQQSESVAADSCLAASSIDSLSSVIVSSGPAAEPPGCGSAFGGIDYGHHGEAACYGQFRLGESTSAEDERRSGLQTHSDCFCVGLAESRAHGFRGSGQAFAASRDLRNGCCGCGVRLARQGRICPCHRQADHQQVVSASTLAAPAAVGSPLGDRSRAAAASLLLESKANKVTGTYVEACRRGCRSWFCRRCCIGLGAKLRDRLIPRLMLFRRIMMLTVTIDPLLFSSPQAAFEYVRDNKLIARLVRRLFNLGHLRSRHYFSVVEWQRGTEQPHWHILVDADYVPYSVLQSVWDSFRPCDAGPIGPGRPGLGWTNYQRRDFAGGAEHAANYASKYLRKYPEHGFPSWVLDSTRRIRRYQTSHGFWNSPRVESEPTGKTRELEEVSYSERVSRCGNAVNLFICEEFVDAETGEVSVRRHWADSVTIWPDSSLSSLVAEGYFRGLRLTLNWLSVLYVEEGKGRCPPAWVAALARSESVSRGLLGS